MGETDFDSLFLARWVVYSPLYIRERGASQALLALYQFLHSRLVLHISSEIQLAFPFLFQ